MRFQLFSASAILLAGTATAQSVNFKVAPPRATSTTPPTAVAGGGFSGGGADCASAIAIGVGPLAGVAFDTTTPASGGSVTNPFEVICEHEMNNGIDNEEWFSWTAASDGVATMSTCGLTGVDTKIAIYADDCANIGTLDPIACKDWTWFCGGLGTPQTIVTWDITMGTTYRIQLGNFPALAGGPGTFDLTEAPPRADGQHDLSISSNASGGNGMGDFDQMIGHTFDAGSGAMLNSVDIAWGTTGAPALPAGLTAQLVIYSGDSTSLTYLADQTIAFSMENTDTFVNYPLTSPVAVSGLYSVGVVWQYRIADGAHFPFGWDDSVNSLDTVGNFARAWEAFEVATLPLDFMMPGSIQGPPNTTQFWGDDKVWMLRANTGPGGSVFTSSCNGDGGNQMGCTDCPCGNNAPMGTVGGCTNSSGNSTRIDATGSTSVSLPQDISETSDLRLTLSGAPSGAFCVMLSGGGVAPAGMANPCFGLGTGVQSPDRDGLRCAVGGGQALLRHGGRSADGAGEVMASTGPSRVWGGEAQPAAGIFGQAGFIAGQTRQFQVTHREDMMAVCMRGLNTSQALEVTFTP